MVSISTVHILGILSLDLSTFWGLEQVRVHLRQVRFNLTMSEVQVDGTGLLVEHLRATIDSFLPYKYFNFDMLACLPNPIAPKMAAYRRILILISSVWLSIFFEAYGLRIRHKILAWFYPQLAKERAHWLYVQIVTDRKLFVTLARREARRKFLKDQAGVSPTTICRLYQCNLCQKHFKRPGDLIPCIQRACKAYYCHLCQESLNGTCPLCMDPVTYGDFSDYSEEFGSTDEEDFHAPRYLNSKN